MFAAGSVFVLYESPVMSVVEGTGFHPFVVPARRDGGLYESPVMAVMAVRF
jgi:hypothetical protein